MDDRKVSCKTCRHKAFIKDILLLIEFIIQWDTYIHKNNLLLEKDNLILKNTFFTVHI